MRVIWSAVQSQKQCIRKLGAISTIVHTVLKRLVQYRLD